MSDPKPTRAGPEIFRLIAEFTYDWESWVDERGRTRWVNAAVERITGYQVEECLSMAEYPLALVHPEDRAMLSSVLADAARGGSGNDVEFRVLPKQGGERWVAISWQAVRGARGVALGYRTSIRDIDERKRMERELATMRRRAEAAVVARSELLANVSHELRSPAHCIAGYAELLAAGELDPTQRRYVEIISAQCAAMLRQVEDLLQLAAIETGGVPLKREAFDVEALVRELVDANLPTAAGRSLTLRHEIRAPNAWLEGDGLRIRQVFRNLLDNALKFTSRGEVCVRLAVEPAQAGLRRVFFEVEDTGIGMEPEEIGRMLAPFQQADGATTRRHGGVGLGLAIAHRLVRQMGGSLDIESEPGKGTRARVTLQLPPALPKSQEVPSEVVASLPGGRALIVDDSAPARELLRAMLELLGWKAVEADSGASARALSARESFDLVLLDYQMPDADGAETALALRKLLSAREPQRKLAIYLLTANLFVHEQLSDFAAVDGILAKPLSRAALLKLLSKLSTPQRPVRSQAGWTLDPEVIEDLRALQARDGGTMLAKVAERVRGDQRRDLDRLQVALAARDWAAAGRLAHALAGHAALVGARRATELARELETRIAQSGLEPADGEQALRGLRGAWGEADAALTELLGFKPG